MFTRRSLLSTGAAAGASAALAACATTVSPTGVTTYGLDPAVVAYIQSAVNFAKQYVPTLESIAGTAISVFGPQYASLVTIGSAAINTIINTLVNLIPGVAPAAMRLARFGRSDHLLGKVFVGWATTPRGRVPIYSEH